MQPNKASRVTDEMIEKVQKGTMQMGESDAIALAGELYRRGRYKQAINVCRQIIKHKPTLSDAHNILGVCLNALGNAKEGVASVKRAIKLAPKIASYHANLGEILRTKGDHADALIALLEAVRLDPTNAQAQNNLGIVRYDRKEYDDAVKCYQAAIAIDPAFAEAYNNLGNALRMTGDVDGAMKAYQDALAHREVYPEAYNNLGTLLSELKETEKAEHALRKAILQNPRYVDAYNNIASIYHAESRDVDALREMSEVLKFAPRNPKSLVLTARIQLKRSNHQAAEQACRMVLEDDPSNGEALTVLGQVMHELDRYDEAIELLEKSLELNPDQAEALNFYGVALKSVGRLSEAREQILKALQLNDTMYGAYANLNDLVDFSKETELFERIEAIMEAVEDQNSERLLPMHFAYAKALDDTGQHEKALEHYIAGGRLKRAQLRYVEEETYAFFDGIKKAFPPEIFVDRPFKGSDNDKLVFIVGMPRSGSTLVEQIISSHPDVFGAGEVKYLSKALHLLRDRFPSLSRYPDLMSELSESQYEIMASRYLVDIMSMAGDAKKVTDKLLTNYFFVGLIHLLFPKAKIINTRRDPVDTCLSAFSKLFKDDMPHSYDLGEIGRYYRQYDSLMEHWKRVLPPGVMTDVVYEEVVGDTEKAARELIEFVGLEWDPVCLEFHASTRPVKTASVAQVRKPIYKSAMKRGKKYGPGLQPLLDGLDLKLSS
ncbi:MAG TPA: tetratricopeptide repeat protein [Croceibacterium sp.]|nr:tetratricopeptide repeat protein [Croceibacterium sp.]